MVLAVLDIGGMSLPSRERGLKLLFSSLYILLLLSLPSRERGLKFDLMGLSLADYHVAPLAGAWIEIQLI